MLRLTLWTAFLCFSFIPASQAGFEWLPPEKNPAETGSNAFDIPVDVPTVKDRAITPIYQAPPANASMADQSDPFMAHKTPRQPVMAQPTGRNNIANAYKTPRTMAGTPNTMTSSRRMGAYTQERPALTNAQDRPVSLYIDPYPMGRESTNSQAREMRASSVEQAMIERSSQATPLMMGQNLQTGAQIAYAQTPTVNTPENNPIGNLDPYSLSPVSTMGGLQSGPVNPTQIRRYANIEGFGSDLPLALALNQVIPPAFVHSFALGVDPGTTVSWQGGKPWNMVLEDMLRPQGLTATIRQNTVTIQPIIAL